jgi:hypothetical protein
MDAFWDKAVVAMRQVECLVLSEADVQHLSARRDVTIEAGPIPDRRLLAQDRRKLPLKRTLISGQNRAG